MTSEPQEPEEEFFKLLEEHFPGVWQELTPDDYKALEGLFRRNASPEELQSLAREFIKRYGWSRRL
ncbi:MAG: hypothetical protein M5U08_16420 [Burkholderiales bacterium]|nr:hypothetical protein [Burkholderiales bacterium]